MNSSSYLGYLKNRNPLRFLSDIFRSYKKPCDEKDVKRNQSEPAVVKQKLDGGDLTKHKPKSVENLNGLCSTPIEQWTNVKFNKTSSQESLNDTWSNPSIAKTSSNISLTKKQSYLDLNIREKLEKIPVSEEIEYSQKSTAKRAYPWQNFNLTNTRKIKYEEVRPVNNITKEIINWKRPILCKPNFKIKKDTPIKEVKFNDTASLVVYPKDSHGVMKQSKINLCTNICRGNTTGVVCKKKRMDPAEFNCSKTNNIKSCVKKNARGKVRIKYMPSEQSGFWYLNKKQKIF